MNITWLDINSSYSHSSLALPAIEACKSNDCNNWNMVSGTINSDIYLITNELNKQKPDVVAATLWLFNHEVTIKICRRIKALRPECIIVLGGPEFNGDNHDFLKTNKFIDAVFRGEGEYIFHQWLEVYEKKEKWQEIKGACYIDSSGEYKDGGKAIVADFESVPAPETSRFFNFDSPFVQIETSRGCFNSCAFCVSGADKPVRMQSIEKIAQRLELISSKGIKDVRVLDRTFNFSPSRALEMFELFKSFPSMNFHLEIHPALLTSKVKEAIAMMPKGMLHLEAGMQSLSDEVLIASGRKGESTKAMEGVKFLCSLDNFETHTDLIAGLPKYTLKQIISDVRELSEVNAGEIQLELLKLLPGTQMRAEAEKHGIRYASDTPYEVLETPYITMEELDISRMLSKLIDRFYNAKGWQSVTRKLINENEHFLEKFLYHLISLNKLEQPQSLEKRGSLLYYFCKEHYPAYLEDISLQWICNGMSLKREEAGDISKISIDNLPESIELDEQMRYYIYRGNERYIIGFNRAKNHSHPELVVKV